MRRAERQLLSAVLFGHGYVAAWGRIIWPRLPHPAISDLIYHSTDELTAAEIVEQAFAYKPIQL